jgi:hypothetical protein
LGDGWRFSLFKFVRNYTFEFTQFARRASRLILRMKKLLVLSAVLIGAASASQAGGINLRIGFPLPTPPRLVFTSPAPVVVAPRDCYTPQVVVAPPVCETPVVVRDDCYRVRRPFITAREWNKNHRWGNDRGDHRH